MLIDTHAHLFWDSYKQDLDAVIERAAKVGLGTIINIGTDLDTSEKALNLKSDKIQFYASIGIHPHEAIKYILNPDVSIHQDIDRVEKLIKGSVSNPTLSKVIAVGECGLDYFFENNPDFTPTHLSVEQIKDLQKKLFQAQIKLSKKLNLPLIIHCRDGSTTSIALSTGSLTTGAWTDIFDGLDGAKGVFHTFSGSPADAKKALHLGFYLSFSAIITYPKNEYLRQIIKDTPLDKILTETDCPFLPPQGKRGHRNEPAAVKEIVQVISELKRIPFNEVVDQISHNAKQLFAF